MSVVSTWCTVLKHERKHLLRDWILLVCFSWRYDATEVPRVNFVMCEAIFRNLHVDPLSLHTSMRNKQVEFDPYIYTLSKLYRFGYEISVFNTKHPVIILRASLFVVTPSHVASSKNGCQNFSYVYRSRKHLSFKIHLWRHSIVLALIEARHYLK